MKVGAAFVSLPATIGEPLTKPEEPVLLLPPSDYQANQPYLLVRIGRILPLGTRLAGGIRVIQNLKLTFS